MLVSWAHTYGKHDVGALIGYEESRNWGDEVDICKEGMSSVNLTDFDAMTDPYYIKGSSLRIFFSFLVRSHQLCI